MNSRLLHAAARGARIECNAPTAAKVIPMLVQLEKLGMEDC